MRFLGNPVLAAAEHCASFLFRLVCAGPLSTKIAGSLLSTVLVVDPLADGLDPDEEDEDDEDDEVTPRPQICSSSSDAVHWEDTPTPGVRESAGTCDEDDPATPNQELVLSGARTSSCKEAFSQLFGLFSLNGERQRAGHRLSGPRIATSTTAASCFVDDAPALWFGTNGDGLSAICSEQLRLSQVSQVVVLGELLLRDWELTRDAVVRSALCALAKRITTILAAAKVQQRRESVSRGSVGGAVQQQRWSWEVDYEHEYQSDVLRQLDGIARTVVMETLCPDNCMDKKTAQACREQCNPTDIAWALELHLHFGSVLDGRQHTPLKAFERLVGDVANTFYKCAIAGYGARSSDAGGVLDARGLHKGFGQVMGGIEDMVRPIAE